MKSKTTIVWCMLLLFTTMAWAQKTRTINQQQFSEEKEGWKLVDEQTGQKFALSDEITIQFQKAPSQRAIQRLEETYGMKLMKVTDLVFMTLKSLPEVKFWTRMIKWPER